MRIACSICSNLFSTACDMVVTTCGHVYHPECLQSWNKVSKTCPQCRSKVVSTQLRKVYFDVSAEGGMSAVELENEYQLSLAKNQLLEVQVKELGDRNKALEKSSVSHKTEASMIRTQVTALKKNVASLTREKKKLAKESASQQRKILQLEKKNATLKAKLVPGVKKPKASNSAEKADAIPLSSKARAVTSMSSKARGISCSTKVKASTPAKVGHPKGVKRQLEVSSPPLPAKRTSRGSSKSYKL